MSQNQRDNFDSTQAILEVSMMAAKVQSELKNLTEDLGEIKKQCAEIGALKKEIAALHGNDFIKLTKNLTYKKIGAALGAIVAFLAATSGVTGQIISNRMAGAISSQVEQDVNRLLDRLDDF